MSLQTAHRAAITKLVNQHCKDKQNWIKESNKCLHEEGRRFFEAGVLLMEFTQKVRGLSDIKYLKRAQWAETWVHSKSHSSLETKNSRWRETWQGRTSPLRSRGGALRKNIIFWPTTKIRSYQQDIQPKTMSPNQPDKENNPNDKPRRVLHNPYAPRAKKPRQASAVPNPYNRAPRTPTEVPTPTNDTPTTNTNDEATPTTTPTPEDANPDQNPTGMGTQSQFRKATTKQNTKAPKYQAKHYLPSRNLNDCLQYFDRLKSCKKCISVEKKKELDLVDPDNTFKVSKKAHHPHCELSQKRKTDEEKAAIERENQLNAPLQEHKNVITGPPKQILTFTSIQARMHKSMESGSTQIGQTICKLSEQ